MRNIYQYILMAIAVVAMASCSQEEMFAPAALQAMNFVVSDFPTYGDNHTRVIGKPEDGKTAWVEGDQLFITFNMPKCGVQTATLTYTASQWASTENIMFEYVPGETLEITAVYAPSYNFDASSGNLTLKEGKQAGTDEYLKGTGALSADSKSVNIIFSTRTYSRLRIAAAAGQELTVAATGFTPVGPTGTTAPANYTLTTNANGNAYLYGVFKFASSVTAKIGGEIWKKHTFRANTQASKSYVLDVTEKSKNYRAGDIVRINVKLSASCTGCGKIYDGSLTGTIESVDKEKNGTVYYWVILDCCKNRVSIAESGFSIEKYYYKIGDVVRIETARKEYCNGCGRLVNNSTATITGIRGILDGNTVYWITRLCCGHKTSYIETSFTRMNE